MNNVFVYCEMEGKHVADVSLELLTKGRKLATQLGCQLETICAGTDLADVEKQVLPYGVDRVHVFDAPGLFPYTSLPHTSILVNLFKDFYSCQLVQGRKTADLFDGCYRNWS